MQIPTTNREWYAVPHTKHQDGAGGRGTGGNRGKSLYCGFCGKGEVREGKQIYDVCIISVAQVIRDGDNGSAREGPTQELLGTRALKWVICT